MVSLLLLFQWVLNAVECQLLTTVGSRFNSIKDQLWKTIDEAITLQDCVIYRYILHRHYITV